MSAPSASIPRRLAAEALGTAALLAIVVGSGIMAERLSGGNDAVALLANTAATGAGLYVLIVLLGPVSGAHRQVRLWFNEKIEGDYASLVVLDAKKQPITRCETHPGSR